MIGHITFKNSQGELLQKIELTQLPLVIGRGSSCDIILESNKISKKHAMLLMEQDQLIIKDLGSSNGLMLGAIRVEQVDLSKEIRCNMGDLEVEFESTEVADKTVVMPRSSQGLPLPSANSDPDVEFKTVIRPRSVAPSAPIKPKKKSNKSTKKTFEWPHFEISKLLKILLPFKNWVQNHKKRLSMALLVFSAVFLILYFVVGILDNNQGEPGSEGYVWYVSPPQSWLSRKPAGIQREDLLKRTQSLILKSQN